MFPSRSEFGIREEFVVFCLFHLVIVFAFDFSVSLRKKHGGCIPGCTMYSP